MCVCVCVCVCVFCVLESPSHDDWCVVERMVPNVPIFRTSLDQTSDAVRESSLLCLRQLLDDQFDEACLDAAYSSERGHLQPSFPTAVISDPEKRAEFRRDEAQLKDAEVCKLDVVLGMLRTDILQR